MERISKLMLCLGLLLGGLPVYAIRFERGGDIAVNQKVGSDFYAAGNSILLNAPVQGDIMAAGNTITVNDSIGGDLIVIGGTVMVNGYVADDIRMAGGTLRISRAVYGDVIVVGGSVQVDQTAVIYGDLIVSSGRITVDGAVKGLIELRGGTLYLNGNAGKPVKATAEKLYLNGSIPGNSALTAEQIHVGPQATVWGNVRYWQTSEANPFGNAIKSGRAIFDPGLRIDPSDRQSGLFRLWVGPLILFYLGSALLLIFLFQYLMPHPLKNAALAVQQEPVRSLGYGLLYLAGVPALVLLLMISLIGIPVGLVVLCLYLFTVLFAFALTAVVTANWLNIHYKRNWRKLQLTAVAFGGYLLIRLVSFLPVFGWFVVLLAICVVFGGLVSLAMPARRMAAAA